MPSRLHLFGLNIIYSLQNAAMAFFASPYLFSIGYSQTTVGLVFVGMSVCALLLLANFARLLQHFGAHGLFVLASFVCASSFVILGFALSPIIVTTALMLASLSATMLWLVFDIGLEFVTKKEGETGRVRSLFLTTANVVFVFTPVIAGALIVSGGYTFLFLMLALSLMILTVYGFFAFPHVPHTVSTASVPHILDMFMTNHDVRRVFSAQFLLQFFYVFMSIYVSISLLTIYGFSVDEMAMILSVAMLAFLLMELPIGYIGDTWLGEKEIMIAGFVVLVLSTALLPTLAGTSVLVLALAMFVTRVGAASIEITTEAYFFKHVDSSNAAQVSAFRMLRPLASLCLPLLGTLYLSFFSLASMPIAVALCIAFVAALELPGLRDTK